LSNVLRRWRCWRCMLDIMRMARIARKSGQARKFPSLVQCEPNIDALTGAGR
jgi:hypothetical protein